ncbi:MAG TPA: patatin-like phospholipase family protein [Dehalococcoidia bacterium]|nr:patatin-like phospholipase family protein [Dehalococcoidia bacterium]
MASRALVMGGGGVVGVAWETGILKGLRDGGIDPAAADLIVGTSAGSITGTQVRAGRSLDELYAAQTAPDSGEIRQQMAKLDIQALTALFQTWASTPEMTEAVAREIGQMALAAPAVDEGGWLQAIASALGVDGWPAGGLIAVAVDAGSGTLAAWDRASGAPLLQAVASSCAVPGMFPPVTINGRRYMDGGVRSGTNADLASGHDTVVIVAPIGARPEGIGRIARQALDAEAHLLREAGAAVEVLLPDDAALAAFGPDLMNPDQRQTAAEAGLRQGAEAGARLRGCWA